MSLQLLTEIFQSVKKLKKPTTASKRPWITGFSKYSIKMESFQIGEIREKIDLKFVK